MDETSPTAAPAPTYRARRRALIAVFVGGMLLLSVGAGGEADGPQAVFDPDRSSASVIPSRTVQAGEVEGSIEFMTWSSPDETALLRKVVADFRKQHPQIKVRFNPYAGDYNSAILTRFASGDPPDVFVVDNKIAPDWVAKGMMQPLDGFVTGTNFPIHQFHEPLLRAFQDPYGHLYGIPKDYSTLGLYVNPAMLRKAGLKRAPRTWEELRVWSQKLTTKDHYGMCIAPSWERLNVFALQSGGGIVNDSWTKMMVDSSQTRNAVQWYTSFVKDGIGATPQSVGASWCGDAFGKKKVAMAAEGNWMLPVLERSFPTVGYEIANLPKGPGPGNLAYSPGYSVAQGSKSPDAAWTLVQYLTGRDGMKKWTDQGLALPARKDVPMLDGRTAFAVGLKEATPWQLPPGFFNKVLLTSENELTAVLQGDQSVDGMLKRIDEVGQPLLKQQSTAFARARSEMSQSAELADGRQPWAARVAGEKTP